MGERHCTFCFQTHGLPTGRRCPRKRLTIATNLPQQDPAQNVAIPLGESTIVLTTAENMTTTTISTAPISTGLTHSDELILLELQSYRLD